MTTTWTDATDDVDFVDRVNAVVAGVSIRYKVQQIRVTRIDNWFDSKWLQFAGKTLGALGVWDRIRVIVPPFVANRLTARSMFDLDKESNSYHYVGEGPQIHFQGAASDNLNRRLKLIAPQAAVFWYSGKSKNNGRGSLMGYVPFNDKQYWGFFLGFQLRGTWKPMELANIGRKELEIFEHCTTRLEMPLDAVNV